MNVRLFFVVFEYSSRPIENDLCTILEPQTMPATLNVKLNAQPIRQPTFTMWCGCLTAVRERDESVNSLCWTVCDSTYGVARRNELIPRWMVCRWWRPTVLACKCICWLSSAEKPAVGQYRWTWGYVSEIVRAREKLHVIACCTCICYNKFENSDAVI